MCGNEIRMQTVIFACYGQAIAIESKMVNNTNTWWSEASRASSDTQLSFWSIFDSSILSVTALCLRKESFQKIQRPVYVVCMNVCVCLWLVNNFVQNIVADEEDWFTVVFVFFFLYFKHANPWLPWNRLLKKIARQIHWKWAIYLASLEDVWWHFYYCFACACMRSEPENAVLKVSSLYYSHT